LAVKNLGVGHDLDPAQIPPMTTHY